MPGKSHWERLTARPKPGLVRVVVESPAGSRNKYKHEPETGIFRLIRVLPDDAAFPFDYGYVPGTRSGDGDPLDVVLIARAPTFPGCVVQARPVGMLRARKKGSQNDRLIAVPTADKTFEAVTDLSDLGADVLARVERFFTVVLRGIKHELGGFDGAEAAQLLVDATLATKKHGVKRRHPAKSNVDARPSARPPAKG